jgi:AMMECR1 domain-containing protein
MKNRSLLLQLARDSIQEVFEAKRTIEKSSLLSKHPILNDKITTTVNIYFENKLRGSSSSNEPKLSLLEDIILNAKRSAFQDINFNPLTTSEYLHSEIEIILNSKDGVISERDGAIIDREINLAKVFDA